MAFADELLDLARRIASLDGVNPQQASLRRAVSTAYYALFHLAIGEATANWSQSELRPLLGRVFEHGKMKQACSRLLGGKSDIPPFEKRATPEDHLRAVAKAFVQAQEQREDADDADYDVAAPWSRGQVEAQIESVADAFRSWTAIRGRPDAQEFLVLLLGPKQRRGQA
ncbi:conserved hypothetical protein [Candidatus Sulfopaludibacter sp. SbA4]|nr:conserved hypothetical protein [Candidatus Sulfopaludibacter sp. SbA4]